MPLNSNPVAGRVDNVNRRSGRDAIQGHYCAVDLTNATARAAVNAARTASNLSTLPGVGTTYGIYLEPDLLDGNGFPTSAVVQLVADGNVTGRGPRVAGVPYDALIAADPR